MTMSNEVPATSGKARLTVLWTLSILTALTFFAAGGPKLAGAPAMVEIFDKVGFGQWFRYFTGLLEVTAAICLLIPRYAFYGAIALVMEMIGAIIAQLTVLEHSLGAPVVLLVITGVIGYLRKSAWLFTARGNQVRG
jgi:putative oxidoreductase